LNVFIGFARVSDETQRKFLSSGAG
jgi:hypothetical protein